MSTKKNDPIDAEVGRRICIQRRVRHMSQKQLGDALGLTFQQIQKYEKGTNRVGAGRLARIAKLLGVSVGFFFGADADEINAPASAQDELTSRFLIAPGAVQLVQAYEQVRQPAVRRAIVELVKKLAVDNEPKGPHHHD